MSVSKNIPQHPGAPSSKVVDLCWIYRPDVTPVMKLDPSWWPESRSVPTDGTKTRRVQRQMYAAAWNRDFRSGDLEF